MCGEGVLIIPIPREATSVATMMGLLPVLNSFKTQSRSFCCLSPWIAGMHVSFILWYDRGRLTKSRPSILSKEACDIVSDTFGSSKDQNLVVLVLHNLLKVL